MAIIDQTRLRKTGRRLVNVAALLFVLQVLLVLTGVPRPFKRWLTAKSYALEESPQVIVVLGGGGIPSESGLIRAYYAAETGRMYPDALLVAALPADEDPDDSSVGRMRDELVMRGIAYERVLLEHDGRNTYEQAVYTSRLLGADAHDKPLLIVSSPYHLRRSVLCFKKAGFTNVGVLGVQSIGAEADPGGGVWWRYAVWQNASSNPEVVREYVALMVYKLRGWI